jgi:uncharacterized protein (UPF0303 family)
MNAADIASVKAQEQRLVLSRVDLDLAWQIGTRLRALARDRNQALAIEVRLNRETVFFAAMDGVTPVNADWARRKRNTVELMQRSSLGVGLESRMQGRSVLDSLGLPTRDFAEHGGSFPLQLAGVGCVGAVTVSGAPERVDHALVVQVLAELAGVLVDDIALDR